ncbi:uncharacterized protein LOC141528061 [Cotesia typhae]|uniref:uncharacterized protein LOC141528061 n=1 Tax=Cotesia typhae TaxID=2053667 RepID=UPI003D697694
MLAVRGIYRHYLKEHRQLSEKHINEKIDDYVEYIRGKISDLERPKKIPLKKTEKEEANEIEKKADGKKKKSKARIQKKKVSSSSDNSSSSEESTDSESETSSNEDAADN